MAADRDRVIDRVQEILNLVEPGTYGGALSARNKTRHADAIEDFVDEAGLMILKAIAERPNEFRYPFLDDTTVTTSGDEMPEHLGPPARVLITPYNGGDPVEGKQKSFDKIESYRANIEQVYDEFDHDEEGSTLSGYYDIWQDKFYFTGYSAVLNLARLPVRADNTTLIPEILENCWIRLALGEAAKVGTGGYESAIIGEYGRRGMADLQAFITGERVFPEVDSPAAAQHVVG